MMYFIKANIYVLLLHQFVELFAEPHFTLCKWVADDAEDSKNLKEGNDGLYQKANSMRQRHKDISQLTGDKNGLFYELVILF